MANAKEQHLQFFIKLEKITLEHMHYFRQHLVVKKFIMQTKFQCFSKSEDGLKLAPKLNDAIIACI
jgi:hypothetical protein